MKKLVLFALAVLITGAVMAQRDDTEFVNLDDSTHGTSRSVGQDFVLSDDGGLGGDYSVGHDFRITLVSSCDTADTNGNIIRLAVQVAEYDIACRDTLYIYDGPDTNSRLLIKLNNCFRSSPNETFYVGPNNPTGEMTVRFRTPVRDTTGDSHKGFRLAFKCDKPCERPVPVIDSVFDRTDLVTGAVIGHGVLRWVPQAIDTVFYTIYDSTWTTFRDTVYDTPDSVAWHIHDTSYWVYDTTVTDSIIRIDSIGMIRAALLCAGQGVILHGHGDYTYNTGYYTPADSNTMFMWSLNGETYNRIGGTACVYNGFQDPGCPVITLEIEDVRGCKVPYNDQIQARISPNPIKTIFDLSEICNTDSLLVNVGYSGDNGTLTLKKITFQQSVTKVNNIRVFIPDGPRCDVKCYYAPVDFEGEFPAGQKVKSASEICSICINYEHSFMGDYRVAIQCPTYDENVSSTAGMAVLKYGPLGNGGSSDPLAPEDSPDGSGGGGMFTGWALDNGSSDQGCDSLDNPFGIGLDYCWSRNENYTLVTGDLADVPTRFQPGGWYISSSAAPTIQEEITIPQSPSYFRNRGGHTATLRTRKPSNHEDKIDYYSPASDFSELVGCPLSGVWNAVICDFWSIDNGWVFNWSLDICGLSQGVGGCDYQVGIDSVIWRPDTNYATDFREGLYTGLRINKKIGDTTAAYISSPDTSGNFRIILSIYDEFGCRWDTLTNISTVHTPRPNLGNDITLCGVNTITLDARDWCADRMKYEYTWEPFGDTTPTIETRPGDYGEKTYIVEVNNYGAYRVCPARDTIVLAVNPQPIPNFDPGIYPLEGCEPFTININNTTSNGYKYHWVFGDGTYSTQKDPSHSYAAGVYDFKYYVESDKGCKDSLIYSKLVNVYPSPKASFAWDPVFPTVLHPSISLINNTAPDDGSNKYFWEIQYDKNNPYSLHTLTENSPTFEWTAASGEDVSGSYTVRLIARSDNYAPSGHLIQCADTVENTILLINDNILFPNVVTPNGDGINDRFVIGNLIEGLAYPINQLDIYDKWGSRVFHAVNIQRDDQFWDPAKTNTPAGTYFYRFSGKGYKGNLEHNGVIEVLR